MSQSDQSAELLGPLAPSADGTKLPLFEGASCGFASPAEHVSEPPLSLDDLVHLREPSMFLVRAAGTSMIEAGVYPHDILIVDRAREARSGDVVMACVGAEFLVKRLVVSDGGDIRLEAANRDHPPVVFGEEEEVQIWGVCTYNLHRLSQT
ncbi:LexA family transcriptional regulator [Halomonas sp. I5-271120]|uniref:LexA family protein n=1 Tax=Halomonas sp. I5-271120 TaxID=3061632 RepID=UPI002714E59A|nr:S24 family peptidase [Halomonas sp. I5-271120]